MPDLSELKRRYGALSPEQVNALDRAAVAAGVAVLQLMELAGLQVARCAWELLGQRSGPVTVYAGRGNNGGDGAVAARLLATWGCAVRVCVLAEPENTGELLRPQLHAAQACGAAISFHSSENGLHPAPPCALFIDALLGTGLRSEPRSPHTAAIRAMDLAEAPVLAVDVPSGLDAGSGRPFQHCVRATRTCTLAAMKAGLWAESARPFAGEIVVGDIGMPSAAWEACGLPRPSAVTGGGLLPIPSTTE